MTDEHMGPTGDHEHQYGPLERSHLAGTVHRKCMVPGCRFVAALDDDDWLDEDEDGGPDDGTRYILRVNWTNGWQNRSAYRSYDQALYNAEIITTVDVEIVEAPENSERGLKRGKVVWERKAAES